MKENRHITVHCVAASYCTFLQQNTALHFCCSTIQHCTSVAAQYSIALLLQDVLNYLHVQNFPADQFKFLQAWPRRDLSLENVSLSLRDLKIPRQETITIEERWLEGSSGGVPLICYAGQPKTWNSLRSSKRIFFGEFHCLLLESSLVDLDSWFCLYRLTNECIYLNRPRKACQERNPLSWPCRTSYWSQLYFVCTFYFYLGMYPLDAVRD